MPGAIPISIPAPTVLYDTDLVWPANDVRIADAGAFVVQGIRQGAAFGSCWGAASGAGYNLMGLDARKNFGAYFASDGLGAVVSRTATVKYYGPLLKTGLAGTFVEPAWRRLWRWQFTFAYTAAANGLYAYAGLCPEAGAEAGGADGAGNRFLGLAGDGAGNWVFACRKGAGAGFDFTQALGIACTAFTVWDLVILAPTVASDATVTLYANGAPLVTKAWGVGTVLPDYSSPANASHFTPAVGTRDAGVAVQTVLTSCRWMQGQFQVNGSII